MGCSNCTYIDENRELIEDGAFYMIGGDPTGELWRAKLTPGEYPMFRTFRDPEYFQLDQVNVDDDRGVVIMLGGYSKVCAQNIRKKVEFLRNEADWYESALAESS